MDRRQKKTREAIFSAFTRLLAQKDYNQITVQEIIDAADVGRATFYSHFETKDYLLKEMCEELFDHIIESAVGHPQAHSHYFDCDAPDSVFLHLVQHLQKNDYNILELLSSENNDIFLRYFKINLSKLIRTQLQSFTPERAAEIPEDFWVNHISATFVETISFWVRGKMRETPEQITSYFLCAIG